MFRMSVVKRKQIPKKSAVVIAQQSIAELFEEDARSVRNLERLTF